MTPPAFDSSVANREAHCNRQQLSCSGSSRAKTRLNVSCDGMPFSKRKNVLSHGSLPRRPLLDAHPALGAG